MAKRTGKSTNGKSGAPNAYAEYQFINVSLSTAEKARLGTLDIDIEFPVQRIFELANEGFKFSIKEDPKGGGFVAALTDSREESRCYKCILTGRGSTAFNAWVSLAYRHYYMLEESWETELRGTEVPDFD